MVDLKSVNFNLQIGFILIVIGFIVGFIDVKGAIAGYSLIICALAGLLVIIFALMNREERKNMGFFALLKFLLGHSMPVLILIGLVSWVLSINISHFERLEKGDLPDEFKQFYVVTTILFFIELSLLYSYFQKQFTETKVIDNTVMAKTMELMSSQSTMLLYLLSVISTISIGIIQTIVNYYLTDG